MVCHAELERSSVVISTYFFARVNVLQVLGDRPAKGVVLGRNRSHNLKSRSRALTQNETPVCCGGIRDSEKVSLSHIAHVDDGHVLRGDLLQATLHQTLHPATRGEIFLAEGRPQNEARADCDDFKALILGLGCLEVPNGKLRKHLRFKLV